MISVLIISVASCSSFIICLQILIEWMILTQLVGVLQARRGHHSPALVMPPLLRKRDAN